MGHNPITKPKSVEPSPGGLRSFPVDLECLSHMLTSINWWPSQKEKNHIQDNQTSN